MKRNAKKCAWFLCVVGVVGVVPVGASSALVLTFDGPGYSAGSVPPAPWTDRYTALGAPFADLSYQVVAGVGVAGSQAMSVLQNPYFEGAAVYILTDPITANGLPQRVSVMVDPSQNGMFNFTRFGGVSVGRGGWIQDSSAVFRGVNFQKNDWGYAGGDQPTDFPVTGPGGVMGYFVPSAAHDYFEVAFDYTAAMDSILVSVTAPNGSVLTQTTAWDGGPVNKIWLWGSDDTYNGQAVNYDNLSMSVIPEPGVASLLFFGGGMMLVRRRGI